ncbi:MAG: type II toxin-antitoxin system RelE/ParE family toxin [Verrucomicrobiota bacterium]
MVFIETPNFTADIQKHSAEAELVELQKELIQDPTKGALIQGSGGFRKVRMARQGSGKSGGFRVIYYLITGDSILLTHLYAKSNQGNLTAAQLKVLKNIIE